MTRGRYYGVVAQEEAAGDREPRITNSVRITKKAGEAFPIRHGNFRFGPVNNGFSKSDGKANGGVLYLIVIRIVIYGPAEIVGVESEVLEESFGEAGFIIISFGWLDGQLQRNRIEHGGCGGTGKQNVFK